MTRRSESIAALAKALNLLQGELPLVTKQAENSYYKNKYADLASIIDVVRPLLLKHGLAVVQTLQTEGDKCYLFTELLHISGEWLSGLYPINPSKPDPQGLGSAVTYARRYAYQALLGIAAVEDDDDGNAASGKSTAAVNRPANDKRQAVPEVPNNPWLWRIQGPSPDLKGKYVCDLDDGVITYLEKAANRATAVKAGKISKHDADAIAVCFKNQDARLEAVSIAMGERENG